MCLFAWVYVWLLPPSVPCWSSSHPLQASPKGPRLFCGRRPPASRLKQTQASRMQGICCVGRRGGACRSAWTGGRRVQQHSNQVGERSTHDDERRNRFEGKAWLSCFVTSSALFPQPKSRSKRRFWVIVGCFALDVFISYSIRLTSVSVSPFCAFWGLYTTPHTAFDPSLSAHFWPFVPS